jgi:hypothetical protein
LCQNIAGEERVVAYAGKGFNAAESNYSASERELLAVIFSVKRFLPYLFGTKFTML